MSLDMMKVIKMAKTADQEKEKEKEKKRLRMNDLLKNHLPHRHHHHGSMKEMVEEVIHKKHIEKKLAPTEEGEELEVEEDLTNTVTIIHKIKEVTDAYSQLRGWDAQLPDYKLYFYFLCMVHLRKKLRREEPALYDFIFQVEGDTVKEQELQNLENYLFLTQISREQSTQVLEDQLKPKGFFLMRHDKDSDRVAHYIAMNKETKEVVICIPRPTPLNDVLFDVVCRAVTHDLDGKGNKIRVHEDILKRALWLRDQTKMLIQDFLLPSGYNIVLCGHSIGGGVAALLGILLKQALPVLRLPLQKRLQVITFGCPPCVDLFTAEKAKSYITSVVNNKDVVPRIAAPTVRSMHKLFHKMETKLKDRGMVPSDWKSAKENLAKLRKRGKPVLTPIELQTFAEQLFDAEHDNWIEERALMVPGKVTIMWEISLVTEVKTLDAMTGSGTMRSLHMIEIDKHMILDHTPEAYAKTITKLQDEMKRRHNNGMWQRVVKKVNLVNKLKASAAISAAAAAAAAAAAEEKKEEN